MATIDDLNQLMLEYEATYWEKLRAARSAESGLVEARFHVSNGNTMVIVFKLKTLIECIRAVSPQTHRGFEQIYHAADSANFEKVVNQVFAQAESFNLSSGFLQMLPLQCERD